MNKESQRPAPWANCKPASPEQIDKLIAEYELKHGAELVQAVGHEVEFLSQLRGLSHLQQRKVLGLMIALQDQ